MLPACYNVVRIRVCVYSSVLLQSWIPPEKIPFVVEERGKEKIVPVRLLCRERLVCISVACVISNALILYTLPNCHIHAKSSQ